MEQVTIQGPLFIHDCKKCHYLGTIYMQDRHWVDKRFVWADLYICIIPDGKIPSSLIARNSDQDSDYTSCDIQLYHSMRNNKLWYSKEEKYIGLVKDGNPLEIAYQLAFIQGVVILEDDKIILHKDFNLDNLSETRLKSILESMRVPKMRIENMDLHWLNRNLPIHNKGHEYLESAMFIISELLSQREGRKPTDFFNMIPKSTETLQ